MSLYKQLLISEVHRLRSAVSDLEREIEELKDKIDPIRKSIREATSACSGRMSEQMYGLEDYLGR